MTKQQNGMENFVNLLEENPNIGKKWQPLIPYKCDKRLTPETLKLTVLNSPEVNRICKFYSDGDRVKEAQLYDVVKALLEEIGFKRNMAVIRFLGNILNKALQQMSSGVYINRNAVNLAKREFTQNRYPVLYMPCHRSYADFLLMSYICFSHDLEIPAIAAGMDFYGMIGMGSMLRNTGAFFMRRSFSTDNMYWDVFREYVRSLITQYHSGVEFFIEGTRSRSFKGLTPKIGLFSMMLEQFMRRKVFDMLVVPVGVSYERPVEEVLFAYELLGVPKPKESTRGLFKAFEIIDSCHGRMFVNFGETMSLYDYFECDRSIYWPPNDPISQTLNQERLQLINQLSHDIVDKQQQLIVITTFNLIAIYFNYRSMINAKCDLAQLKFGVCLLSNFMRKFNVLLTSDVPLKASTDIIDSMSVHSNVMAFSSINGNLELVFGPPIAAVKNVDLSKLKGHNLLPHTMRNSLPSFLLQIYANPCLYWLHQPAFYVLLQRLNTPADALEHEFDRLKQIFVSEFVTRKSCTAQNFKAIADIMIRINITENVELGDILLTSITPFILCYLHVVEVIKCQLWVKLFTEKELFVAVQKQVEIQLNANDKFVHPYCLSLDSIGNALHSLVTTKHVTKQIISGEKRIVQYSANATKLDDIFHQLKQYSSVLRDFNGASNYRINAKL